MVPSRSTDLGPTSRPVAIPDDFATSTFNKASGVIRLPNRIRWSGPDLTFDLDNAADRYRVYELVLVDGSEEDVRHYVRFDELISVWGDIFLPSYVRNAWQDWFAVHHIDVVCRNRVERNRLSDREHVAFESHLRRSGASD